MEELDMSLLIADFIPMGLEGEPRVTKVYAVSLLTKAMWMLRSIEVLPMNGLKWITGDYRMQKLSSKKNFFQIEKSFKNKFLDPLSRILGQGP